MSFYIEPLPAKEDFKTIREIAREQTNLSEEELDEALDAKKMAGA